MNGNYNTRRSDFSTPRLPPVVQNEKLRYQDQSAIALLEQTYGIQNDMQGMMDERRARQLLEEQVKVITAVCKKLNQDIEVLESQLNDKIYTINTLELKLNETQSTLSSLNKDLQFRMGRYETNLNKLEGDQNSMMNALKDMQHQFQDYNRSIMLRVNDVDSRISELNTKFDSILMEQTMVLKNVEGDTVKQLQLIDSKTRTMLEDVRSQLNQTRANNETDISRMEGRLFARIEETYRNTDKYDRLERRIEEQNNTINKRFSSNEEELQKNLNKISTSIDKLENKVNKGMEEKFTKSGNDIEKVKKDLKVGLNDAEQSIVTLQKVIEGKIKLTEEKINLEIDKIRKMVVLM